MNTNFLTCQNLKCWRDNRCCLNTEVNGVSYDYCAVSSRCHGDPLWMSIAIPAVLFLAALILLIILCCKICSARTETMRVNNFAKKQIRMESRPSQNRLSNITSVL